MVVYSAPEDSIQGQFVGVASINHIFHMKKKKKALQELQYLIKNGKN